MRQMKTMTKLVGLACALSFLTAALSFYSVSGLKHIAEAGERMYVMDLVGLDSVQVVARDILRLVRSEKNLILSDSESALAAHSEDINKGRETLKKDMAEVRKHFYTDQGKETLHKLDAAVAEWLKTQDEIIRFGNSLDQASGKKAQALSADAGRRRVAEVGAVADEAVKMKKDAAKQSAEGISASFERIRLIAILATLASVLFGIAMGFLIARDVVRQLGDEPGSIADIALRIAGGDLEVKFDAKRPEIGVFGAMK